MTDPELAGAMALHQAGRLDEAIRAYRALLPRRKTDPQLNHLLGLALFAKGEAKAALEPIRAALIRVPGHPQLLNDMGNVLRALGRQSEAAEAFRRALAADANFHFARFNLADALLELRRFAEGLAAYDEILARRLPGIDADLHCNRGACLAGLKRQEEAVAAFRTALSLQPGHAGATANLATALQALGRDAESVEALMAFTARHPATTEVLLVLGKGLLGLKRGEEALAAFARAAAADPKSDKPLTGRALALDALGRHAEALGMHDLAIAANPKSAEAHSNRGVTLRKMWRLRDAIAAFEAALRIAPDSADALVNLGNALTDAKEHDAAIRAYRKAIALEADLTDAHANLGTALARTSDLAGSVAAYEAALARGKSGTTAHVLTSLAFTKLRGCDWSGIEELQALIRTGVAAGTVDAGPFEVLGLADDPALNLLAARRHVEVNFGAIRRAVPTPPPGPRIRIGFVSTDFRSHPTLRLCVRMLELLDREVFEVSAFSIGPQIIDAMAERVKDGVDHFHDCTPMPDEAVMDLARRSGLDIAVDLNGYTQGARTALFARGLAPVQVNFLGYPGTIGASFADYILADPTVVPPGDERFYAEQVVRMPHAYQPNDDRREIGGSVPTRAVAGLPEDGFVFCCFNNCWKILPGTFATWMRLLAAVPGSVFWLLDENPAATRNLQQAAASHGIDPTRLVFAKRAPNADHIARHRLADLFLDTLPYNAHTTTSDALWAGLPVLTLEGRAFQARVAASLLRAAEIPDLITTNEAEYEALALALARDPERLRGIRARLAANLPTCPLFDSARFARDAGTAFRRMHERHIAGLPPEGFDV
ncbi:tetratricopeptide repeat protein [Roseomonas sp. JC162]|uniref:protein O-GlcNAc transferase n=1 Tax=Neoroseomonas marina TaxID=1232220 RepID=A0A848EKB6_9PROT|nr:tetratricopeptide repeat protein [Neoroseomonas marina]NMJ44342.1 tetratricopeptide repeat protein [Neoroseomonas marina]